MATKNVIRLGKPRYAAAIISAIALVIFATGVTWVYFASQNQSYWVVTVDVPSGTDLAEVPKSKVSAALFGSQYLAASETPVGYLTQPLKAGDLISTAAISSIPAGESVRVVVPSASTLASTVSSGSKVQIWIATKFGAEYGPAEQLEQPAEVVKRLANDSMFKQQSELVELQVALEQLPSIIDALANDSAIYLVPSN